MVMPGAPSRPAPCTGSVVLGRPRPPMTSVLRLVTRDREARGERWVQSQAAHSLVFAEPVDEEDEGCSCHFLG